MVNVSVFEDSKRRHRFCPLVFCRTGFCTGWLRWDRHCIAKHQDLSKAL